MAQGRRIQTFRCSVVQKLLRVIDPDDSIEDTRERLRIRFVAGLSLIAAPMFIYLQLDSNFFPAGIPMYYVLAFMVFSSYFLSRSGHLRWATWVILASFSLFPYISLALSGRWSIENDIVVVWIVITLFISDFLLDRAAVTVFVLIHNTVFAGVVLFHPGVTLFADNGLHALILPLIGVSFLIFAESWARQIYIRMLEMKNEELNTAQRELELYSSLLTHDLRNDLIILHGRIKLAYDSILLNGQPADDSLYVSLEISKRMSRLLHAFSGAVRSNSDIITLIRKVAQQAELSHPSMSISIVTDDDCSRVIIQNRLLPMVFDNLFRNAAQYAGESPTVRVFVSRDKQTIKIDVSDDGPGLDPRKIPKLFIKGTSSDGSSGLGLYLTKRVLAHYGGEIELIDDISVKGCTFRITLPIDTV